MSKEVRMGRFVIGNVVRLSTVGRHTNAAKPIASVRIPKNDYNPVLKMYFAASEDKWAMLNGVECRIGDQVLVQESEDPLARDVSCLVHRVTREYGRPIDPVSGRRAHKAMDEDKESVFREQAHDTTNTIKRMLKS